MASHGPRKIRVRRRGYRRKSYTRKAFTEKRDGKTIHEPAARVKGAHVPPTEYYTEDRGAPGRTPESKKWFNPKGHLHGWHASQDSEQRHQHLEEASRGDGGWGITYYKLLALNNVTTEEDVKRATYEDMSWIRETKGRALHEGLKRLKDRERYEVEAHISHSRTGEIERVRSYEVSPERRRR